MPLRESIPVLRVTNSVRAESYYCGELGFEKRFAYRPDALSPDPCYLGLERDGVWLHVSSFPGDGVVGAVAHFIVEDLDALHAEMIEAGVEVALQPTSQSWGVRELHLVDPDGNRLRFAE